MKKVEKFFGRKGNHGVTRSFKRERGGNTGFK
jgi:hypothetical protein